LRADSERYRERHISVKLSLYSGFFAFEGLTVAAAAITAQRAPSSATAVIVMALVSTAILFLHYHWFLNLYDVLGYTKISIRSEADIDRHIADNERAFEDFRKRKRVRRFFDNTLYVLAFAQMILLIFAVQ
jgi:hypothetical protein